MAYTRQSNILTNPFSYEHIVVQKNTHHIYKVIQMCRDNNLSHFCQIIFLNSLQAPNKERAPFQSPAEQIPYVSPLATFPFLLFIPEIMEQERNHLHPTIFPAQALNSSYIHRELPNLFINRYIPGPHDPLSVHISIWRICNLHYHRFGIIDSVDKRFKLNKRSLQIRNSGKQKHAGYDFPCFNLPSWTPGTMHKMWNSSERHLQTTLINVINLSWLKVYE